MNYIAIIKPVELLLYVMEYDVITRYPSRQESSGISAEQAAVLLREHQDRFDALPKSDRENAAELVKHGFKHLERNYTDDNEAASYTFRYHRNRTERDRLQSVSIRLNNLKDAAKNLQYTAFLSSLKAGDKFTINHSYNRNKEVEFVKHNPEKSFQYATIKTTGSWGNTLSTPVREVVMVKWADFINGWRSGDIILPTEFEAAIWPAFKALVADSEISAADYQAAMAYGFSDKTEEAVTNVGV